MTTGNVVLDIFVGLLHLLHSLWVLPWKYKIIPLLIIIAIIVVLVYYFRQSRKPKTTIYHSTIPNTTTIKL